MTQQFSILFFFENETYFFGYKYSEISKEYSTINSTLHTSKKGII